MAKTQQVSLVVIENVTDIFFPKWALLERCDSQAKSLPDGDLDLDPDRDFAVPESEPLGDRDTDFDCDLAQLGNLIDLVRLQSCFSILQLLQCTLQGLKMGKQSKPLSVKPFGPTKSLKKGPKNKV